MEEERGLKRPRDDVRPEDGLVNEVPLAGVFQSVQGERNETEQIKVKRAWSGPAAEENVNADREIDESDEAQAQVRAAIRWLGNDFDWCVQSHPISSNGVFSFDVGACAVEFVLKIRDPGHRNFINCREQVPFVNAGPLAGAVWDNLVSLQPAIGFNPPDAVIGLHGIALLAEIQHGEQHQADRSQGQQRCLQPIE